MPSWYVGISYGMATRVGQIVRYGVEPKRTSVIHLGNGGRGSTGKGGGWSGSTGKGGGWSGSWQEKQQVSTGKDGGWSGSWQEKQQVSTGKGGGWWQQKEPTAKGTWSGLVERNGDSEYCGIALYNYISW